MRQLQREIYRSLRTFNVFVLVWKLVAMFVHRRSDTPDRPTQDRVCQHEQISQQEQIWRSGNDGELRVVEHLADRLGDDWTLLAGYRGFGGEVDQILVGPGGVCALEVKNLNGTVYIDGDSWRRDKYDRYGNRVEVGEIIADSRDRSPSQQINDSVEPLQTFLAKRSRVKRISRTVVLCHDRSKLGRSTDQTIECVTTLQALEVPNLLPRMDSQLDRATVEKLIQLIQSSHSLSGRQNRSTRRHRRGSGRRSRTRS